MFSFLEFQPLTNQSCPEVGKTALFVCNINGRNVAVVTKLEDRNKNMFLSCWNGFGFTLIDGVVWQYIDEEIVDASNVYQDVIFMLGQPVLRECSFCGGRPRFSPGALSESGEMLFTNILNKHKATVIDPCCSVIGAEVVAFDGGESFISRWNGMA